MTKTILTAAAIMTVVATADAKSLVAYYSRSGNTRTVAEIIQKTDGNADIFEITTADANHYPADYNSAIAVAKSEIENQNWPAVNAAPDLTEYDTIYVGTPCWWGTMAGPVAAFLDSVDLTDKTVIPFNTHEGSGAGTVHTDIQAKTPNSNHKPGIAIWGSRATDATDEIKKWLNK